MVPSSVYFHTSVNRLCSEQIFLLKILKNTGKVKQRGKGRAYGVLSIQDLKEHRTQFLEGPVIFFTKIRTFWHDYPPRPHQVLRTKGIGKSWWCWSRTKQTQEVKAGVLYGAESTRQQARPACGRAAKQSDTEPKTHFNTIRVLLLLLFVTQWHRSWKWTLLLALHLCKEQITGQTCRGVGLHVWNNFTWQFLIITLT